ncbi:MAG: MFS transporter [Spirochaetes bacterium]|nr:MAG: MFS transporter [Spirochaetota bacterium]RKX77226.1 MAG: MFS transporter [Spirochaetota bacterium]
MPEKTFPWRRNLAAAWLTQILSLTGFTFAIAFMPFYLEELGITDPDRLKLWTGLNTALTAVAMGIMAPIWGRLGDIVGRKTMLIRAMGTGVLIVLGMSFVQSPEGLLVYRIAQGLFTGTITAASALVAAGTPEERMPSSLGFFSTSTFVGITIGPALGGLAAELWGYRTVFRIGSGILALGVVAVIVLIVEPPQHRHQSERYRETTMRTVKRFITPIIIWSLVVLFFMRISRSTTGPFLPLYVREFRDNNMRGTVALSGAVNAGVGLASALGGWLLTRKADNGNPIKYALVYVLLAFTAAVPLYLWNTLLSFSISYVIVFFLLGGIEPLVVATMVREVSPGNRGLLIGIQATVGSTGWAIAPFLGAGVTIIWSLRALFLVLPLLLLVTGGAVLILLNTKNHR